MRLEINNLLTSWKTTAVLMTLYCIGLAAATFIESRFTTLLANQWIYHNPLFFILPLLMGLNFIALVRHHWRAYRRKIGVLILHGAFIVVLTGALITHLFGYEGVMHIRKQASSNSIQTSQGAREVPFTVYLDDFKLTRYPGSHSPSSFESLLRITTDDTSRDALISMNKVVYVKGFRLYQSSYDTDEGGTVLTVNFDMAGTIVTYLGYLLLLIGMLVLFVERSSRIRVLNRRLKSLTTIVLLLLSLGVSAQTPDQGELTRRTLPTAQIDQWKHLLVQCPTGRIEPMDTYCRKLLRKLYRADTYKGIDAEEVIVGFVTRPQLWWSVPLLNQPNKELQKLLRQQNDYLSFNDLFDAQDNYKIAPYIDSAYTTSARDRSRFQKDLLKLDEKANIIYSLLQGKMLALFPLADDPQQQWYAPGDDLSRFSGDDSLFVSRIMAWYTEKPNAEVLDMIQTYQQKQTASLLPSPTQISVELLYNKINPFFLCSMSYMTLGLLFVVCAILALTSQHKKRYQRLMKIFTVFILFIFLLHTLGIAVRWYISGQAPWSNAYESMIYVAWSTLLAGLLFAKRSAVTLALAAFLSGVILLVANMNWMDPEITPLVPVLKSYWLMIHVAVIVASYGFFAISFLLGILKLLFMLPRHSGKPIRKTIKELRIINEMVLQIGLCLMTAGTFVGAIWANESWGRYWGWDPKETWALITLIVYALILHVRHIPRLNSDYAFSALSVLGFSTVLMTYFGVNYYLSGLHSYGGGETPMGIFTIFVFYGLLILFMGYIHYRNHFKKY